MFDVWTKGFRDFFLVFLVLGLVTASLGAFLNYEVFGTFVPPSGFVPGSPPRGIASINLGNLILFGIVVAIVGIVLGSIVGGGMTEYSVRRLRGEAITLEQALRRGLQKFLSIFGAGLLLGLLIFGVIFLPIILLLPLAAAGSVVDPSSVLASICGALAILAVGGIIALYIVVAMSLYVPAIMIEDTNAVEGLSRSWRLTKGHWWSMFGALLAVAILGGIINGVIVSAANAFNNSLVSIIAYGISSAITGSWSIITAAVAYDLIVRQPRFAAPAYYPGPAMGPPPTAPQAPPQPPPAPPAPPRGP